MGVLGFLYGVVILALGSAIFWGALEVIVIIEHTFGEKVGMYLLCTPPICLLAYFMGEGFREYMAER